MPFADLYGDELLFQRNPRQGFTDLAGTSLGNEASDADNWQRDFSNLAPALSSARTVHAGMTDTLNAQDAQHPRAWGDGESDMLGENASVLVAIEGSVADHLAVLVNQTTLPSDQPPPPNFPSGGGGGEPINSRINQLELE